jgi:hypothetical protein
MVAGHGTKAPPLEEKAVLELRASFRGELIRPGDAGYDTARKVFNFHVNQNIKPNGK